MGKGDNTNFECCNLLSYHYICTNITPILSESLKINDNLLATMFTFYSYTFNVT